MLAAGQGPVMPTNITSCCHCPEQKKAKSKPEEAKKSKATDKKSKATSGKDQQQVCGAADAWGYLMQGRPTGIARTGDAHPFVPPLQRRLHQGCVEPTITHKCMDTYHSKGGIH